MKKIFISLSAIALIILYAAPTMDAITTVGKCGDNLTWTVENGDTLVIGGSGPMYDFKWVIDGPETSDIPWFSYRTDIKALVMQAGCTRVGKLAFAGLNIREVELPNSVTEIGANAFASCPLDEAKIPASVRSIGMNAFGFAYSSGVPEKMNEHFTISGTPGSAAERYAQANRFTFKSEAETAHPAVSVTVNGSAVRWTDAIPFINSDGRTMVPLHAVGNALGLRVSWDGDVREASFSDGTKTVFFPIDANIARTSDGRQVVMDTAAVIVGGRTYAPVRYLAEYFGYGVGWDGESRTVSIEQASERGQTTGYSDTELCEMAKAYYKARYGQTPPMVEADHANGNQVTLHLYEISGGHTATWEWYTVDRATGKGESMFSGSVDLTSP